MVRFISGALLAIMLVGTAASAQAQTFNNKKPPVSGPSSATSGGSGSGSGGSSGSNSSGSSGNDFRWQYLQQQRDAQQRAYQQERIRQEEQRRQAELNRRK